MATTNVLEQDAALLAGWGTGAATAAEPQDVEVTTLADELLGTAPAQAPAPPAAQPKSALAERHPKPVATPRPRTGGAHASRHGHRSGSWLDRVELRTVLIWVGMVLGVLLLVLVAISALSGDEAGQDAALAPDTRAIEFQGQTMAVSASAGPQQVTETTVAGFERSALGAALAAWHLSARSDAAAGPAIFGATINSQVLGDRAALLAQRTKQYAEWRAASKLPVPSGSPIPATRNQVLGWSVPEWGDGSGDVTVHLLVNCPSCTPRPGPTQVAVTVRWDDAAGDWRLVATPSFPSQAEDNPNDYTPFFQEGQP